MMALIVGSDDYSVIPISKAERYLEVFKQVFEVTGHVQHYKWWWGSKRLVNKCRLGNNLGTFIKYDQSNLAINHLVFTSKFRIRRLSPSVSALSFNVSLIYSILYSGEYRSVSLPCSLCSVDCIPFISISLPDTTWRRPLRIRQRTTFRRRLTPAVFCFSPILPLIMHCSPIEPIRSILSDFRESSCSPFITTLSSSPSDRLIPFLVSSLPWRRTRLSLIWLYHAPTIFRSFACLE